MAHKGDNPKMVHINVQVTQLGGIATRRLFLDFLTSLDLFDCFWVQERLHWIRAEILFTSQSSFTSGAPAASPSMQTNRDKICLWKLKSLLELHQVNVLYVFDLLNVANTYKNTKEGYRHPPQGRFTALWGVAKGHPPGFIVSPTVCVV